MRFKDPAYFFFIIPTLVFFFLYVRGIIGKEAAFRFSSLKLIKNAGGKSFGFNRIFTAVLRLIAMVLLILALARPQDGSGEEKTTEHVVDIMIALDVSGSMATLDFQPDNRLNAAKAEAKRFIEGRANDRIGLVIFAGQSITQCPLTIDRQAILTLLQNTQLGMLEDGTAIGLGLASSVNRLKVSEAKSKVAILLTDGVNNTGEIDPLTAADLAKRYRIRVYTIGVGKEGEALLPVADPRFGLRYVKIRTEIDEKMLVEISKRTGGQYFRAKDEKGLRAIFSEIDRLEKTEIKVEKYMHYEERYFWFLWPALFLIFIEIIWSQLLFAKIP